MGQRTENTFGFTVNYFELLSLAAEDSWFVKRMGDADPMLNLYFIFTRSNLCLCTLGVYLVVEDQRHHHALHKASSSQLPDAYHEHSPHVRDVEMSERLPVTPLPISFLSTASPSRRVPDYHYLPLSTPNIRQALSVHKMYNRSRSAR